MSSSVISSSFHQNRHTFESSKSHWTDGGRSGMMIVIQKRRVQSFYRHLNPVLIISGNCRNSHITARSQARFIFFESSEISFQQLWKDAMKCTNRQHPIMEMFSIKMKSGPSCPAFNCDRLVKVPELEGWHGIALYNNRVYRSAEWTLA